MKITNELLSAYLDNALTPEERAAVDRALAESPKLRQELADLRHLSHLLKEIPAPAPSEQFYRHVLEKTNPQPRVWLRWTVPLLGAAAAMVMIFIAGEKKSLDLHSMIGATADRAQGQMLKGFDFSEIGDRAKLEVAREKDSSLDKFKIKYSDVQQDMEQLNRTQKVTSPSLTVSENAKKDDRQTNAGGSLRLEQPRAPAMTEWVRGDSGPLEAEMPKVVASKGHSSGRDADKPLSKKQMESSSKLTDPGLSALRTEPSRRSLKETPPQPTSAPAPVTLSESAPLPTEWQGDSSGITEYREVIILDAVHWKKLWAEHQSHMGSPPPAPAVNFNEFSIVGIFLGDRESSGYGAQITNMKEAGKELVVSYRETRPSSSGMQLAVMTQPYHLKAIPRTNRPVRFVKD